MVRDATILSSLMMNMSIFNNGNAKPYIGIRVQYKEHKREFYRASFTENSASFF